jgi:hypothetical protein
MTEIMLLQLVRPQYQRKDTRVDSSALSIINFTFQQQKPMGNSLQFIKILPILVRFAYFLFDF